MSRLMPIKRAVLALVSAQVALLLAMAPHMAYADQLSRDAATSWESPAAEEGGPAANPSDLDGSGQGEGDIAAGEVPRADQDLPAEPAATPSEAPASPAEPVLASQAQPASGASVSKGRASLAKARVAAIKAKTYTGKPIRPQPKVTLGGRTLRLGRDYTLSYKNNRKVGKATIIIRGKGSYKGTKKVTFKIVRKRGAKARRPGPSVAGALAVRDGRLVDAHGDPVQLCGVSTHGLAWFPGYVNDDCFGQLRSWGANVVRLAMYTQEYGGYCAGGSKKELRALVKEGTRLAAQNDLYAIVDWHILSDSNPLTHVKAAKAFFKTMSKELKGADHVIYEICNEPNGGTTWAQVKRYAKKVIPVIRANDPDAVILVGTPTWSQEIDKARADPLPYDNVMYTLHFYAGTHGADLRRRMTDAADGGLPVFVSEFGICDASGNGGVNKKSANAWLKAMNARGISWCMWSLCNKAESASVIKSSCAKTAGFVRADLTTTGKWLLKALK